ncbi:MAG: DUF4190 domain-containing protein [Lachnospiraceae bacterium]|nr:DUF4190 domain-containing protein [Lachnospiraceae bacterium]
MDFYQNSNDNTINGLERPNSFAVASMILGILSIIACCTGVLAIPLGALGILFAVFTKRHKQSMPAMSVAGIWLSSLGILIGILFTAYSFFIAFNDPQFLEQMDLIYQQMYGIGFEEFWKQYLQGGA